MIQTIRKAEACDTAFLAAAEAGIFSDAWSEAALCAHLASPLSFSLILCMDGAPVGYLLAAGVPPESELYRIAVLPEWRGTHAGYALLAAYLGTASTEGYDRFFLEVRASNTPARRLYEKAGYAVIGTRRHYYKDPKEDAVLYALGKETPC